MNEYTGPGTIERSVHDKYLTDLQKEFEARFPVDPVLPDVRSPQVKKETEAVDHEIARIAAALEIEHARLSALRAQREEVLLADRAKAKDVHAEIEVAELAVNKLEGMFQNEQAKRQQLGNEATAIAGRRAAAAQVAAVKEKINLSKDQAAEIIGAFVEGLPRLRAVYQALNEDPGTLSSLNLAELKKAAFIIEAVFREGVLNQLRADVDTLRRVDHPTPWIPIAAPTGRTVATMAKTEAKVKEEIPWFQKV